MLCKPPSPWGGGVIGEDTCYKQTLQLQLIHFLLQSELTDWAPDTWHRLFESHFVTRWPDNCLLPVTRNKPESSSDLSVWTFLDVQPSAVRLLQMSAEPASRCWPCPGLSLHCSLARRSYNVILCGANLPSGRQEMGTTENWAGHKAEAVFDHQWDYVTPPAICRVASTTLSSKGWWWSGWWPGGGSLELWSSHW